MKDEGTGYLMYCNANKKATKRKLAKQLIQHIMTLYDAIIQKIEHGIGMLWQEYFSQQLYTLAKRKVQAELINDSQELNEWFQNISKNIKNKVSDLSDNLLSHFNQIIDDEKHIFKSEIRKSLQFSKEQKLVQIKQSKKNEAQLQYNQKVSLAQTCADSMLNAKVSIQKLCPFCKNDISMKFSLRRDLQGSDDINNEKNTQIIQEKINIQQSDSKNNIDNSLDTSLQDIQMENLIKQKSCSTQDERLKKGSKRKKKKLSQSENEEHDDYIEGGFYGVFLGLLEAFEI